MAVYPKSLHLFFLLLIFVSLFSITFLNAESEPESESESESDLVSELQSLQSRSRSGAVRLDDHSAKRFLTKSPRSYSIFLFFDASQFHDKPELSLKVLRAEFELVASSFISHNKGSPSESELFFCYIDFKDAQSTFAEFGVQAVPHIRLISPHVGTLKDAEQMDRIGMAESMTEFIESRTKLTVGPLKRPPMFTHVQLGFIGLAILACVPYVGKKILKGETLFHDSRIWLAFAVFVYFFSVSGAMHTIIRKWPLYMRDQNNPSSLVFFYQGSGVQLGAEGFAVGFLYTIVGLSLALATHFLVKVKSARTQKLLMILGMIISCWAVKKVVHWDNWKTGYHIHSYWPSSWV